MARKKKPEKRRAYLDSETDPFLWGRVPKPFAWGLMFDDGEYVDFWGDDCTEQLIAYLKDLPACNIWAHNSGKFDTLFLLEHIEGVIKIISGGIAECKLLGKHRLRDSFKIIPSALKSGGGKMNLHDIIPRPIWAPQHDYWMFEREYREQHKQLITKYLRQDCDALRELVEAFIARFGDCLTIGQAAIKELYKLHPCDRMGAGHDAEHRPYYFGGRVQCIQGTGIFEGEYNLYDVNSMYPYVMAHFNHPINGSWVSLSPDHKFHAQGLYDYGDAPFEVHGIADIVSIGHMKGEGANMRRSYNFAKQQEYHLCGHEYLQAKALGYITNEKILEIRVATRYTKFDDFIFKFFGERKIAQELKDIVMDLFCKLIMNNAYGKFCSSPAGKKDYLLYRLENDLPAAWAEAAPEFVLDAETFILGKDTALPDNFFHNVATGASITAAARAVLMLAISRAKYPIYCDTDSLICESLDMPQGKELGQWKPELTGIAKAAISGRKLYALFDKDGKELKARSKGVKILGSDILRIAEEGTATDTRDNPLMSLATFTGERAFFGKRREVRKIAEI